VSAPVTFLVIDATGHGGLARAVITVANALAGHRDVRMISVHRGSGSPRYPLDPRIAHEVLLDEPDGLSLRRRLLRRRPTRLAPDDGRLSALTDVVLRRRLRSLEPGILVSTRPSLHLAATTWRTPGVRLVGWDHLNHPTRFSRPWMAEVLERAVPALDAYVVLTRADADDYRRTLWLPGTRVRVIRNPLSWPLAGQPAPLTEKVVVGAGRLAPVKGFARMIDAFAPVARKHPDWQLHIHGEGPRRAALQARIDALGLGDRVRLPGYADDFGAALGSGSVFAMTSRAEGFPMVLLEAMAEGRPMVAMDCPRGPGEIVVDGSNGLLVDDGDGDGFTRALLALIEDEDLRGRLGRQARLDADQYTVEAITQDWLALLDELDRKALTR
jgi:glycosyltransferase involved in cell wall biosynthesis